MGGGTGKVFILVPAISVADTGFSRRGRGFAFKIEKRGSFWTKENTDSDGLLGCLILHAFKM